MPDILGTPAASKWRPMETAPRDGREVLLLVHPDKHFQFESLGFTASVVSAGWRLFSEDNKWWRGLNCDYADSVFIAWAEINTGEK